MKRYFTLFVFILFFTSTFGQKIGFLRHSVGNGVYYYGNVYQWFLTYNANNGTNYQISERVYPDTPYPWENYPYDYWNLWVNNQCNDALPNIACLSKLSQDYDVIILKHCFDGASILADNGTPSVSSNIKTLANYKLQYRALRALMDTYPNNKFIVWTLAPLHRLATNTSDAFRARQFVDWVKTQWLTEDGQSHSNIYIFDFFGLAAETSPTPVNGQYNCLKYDYEGDHFGSDSHPNLLANQTIGPIFSQFIVNTITSQVVPVTGITVSGSAGATTITTDNGTLQLIPSVSPSNATNQSVIWSLTNGTGQATISVTGLVTAIVNGTVTARATANDGSGVFGELVITISNQVVPVTGITVSGSAGVTTITTDNGTLQLIPSVSPSNATNQSVIWSLTNGTGQATISATGLLSAVDNGTVTARATSNDGSGVYGELIITLSNQVVPVTGITVTGSAGATTITTDNGTLQLSAGVSPSNATNQSVIWSLTNGTGQATISATGLLSAVDNGTVTARATSNDGSGVYAELIITLSNQVVPVTGITVTGSAGATTITTDNGTLQLSAGVSPSNATNQSVIWSLTNGTGQATISATGLLSAVDNGTVTARATSNDGSGVYGELIITLSNQVVPVTSITVTGAAGATTITSDNGTLQLSAAVSPSNATNQSVTWSLTNGSGQATISSTGLVSAVDNGTVTARATANDGSGIYGELIITISNQIIAVTSITVTGATTITTDNGTLQLGADVLPVNATNKSVTWSLVNGTGQASISSTGLVTAIDNGTVTARATANDGSGIYGELIITISNQVIPVTSITVTGATTITTDNGILQLGADVLPVNATNKSVTWSLVNGTGQASISSTGLVTAIDNGTITARATANDGSGIFDELIITILNQVIPVASITVTGATTIATDNGTLQLGADVLPGNSTNKSVTWSLTNGTGQATISSTGLVSAVDNGTVTARATADDGSGVYGELIITLSNQVVPVTGITVTGAAGATTITTDNGTLQLGADVLPVNATNKSVTWSLADGTGQASISSTGLVTAIDNGTVTARATANDGSGIFDELIITISNQVIPVASITVTGATTIATDNGTLQLGADVLPGNATNKSVTWSLTNGTGQATISSTGLVNAVDNGTVTARATADDGSGVYGELIITLSNQVVPITGITVTGAAGATTITTDNGTLQLGADVLPVNATNKSVTWSLADGTGQASISSTGLVTAIDNGTVTARATANNGSGIYGELTVIISNQINPPTLDSQTSRSEVFHVIISRSEMRIYLSEDFLSWEIRILDVSGKMIMTKLIDTDLCVFNTSSVPSGLYIIVLSKRGKSKGSQGYQTLIIALNFR